MITASVTLTPEQEKYFRNNYHVFPKKELARELGLSVSSLYRRAQKAGIINDSNGSVSLKKRQRIHQERFEFIRDNFMQMTNKEMSEKLGCKPATVEAILCREVRQRRKKGVPRLKNEDGTPGRYVSDSICWDCKNTLTDCKWHDIAHIEDLDPIPDYAMKFSDDEHIPPSDKRRKEIKITVTECRRFEAGKLPGLKPLVRDSCGARISGMACLAKGVLARQLPTAESRGFLARIW